jgi:hypothetical protein
MTKVRHPEQNCISGSEFYTTDNYGVTTKVIAVFTTNSTGIAIFNQCCFLEYYKLSARCCEWFINCYNNLMISVCDTIYLDNLINKNTFDDTHW